MAQQKKTEEALKVLKSMRPASWDSDKVFSTIEYFGENFQFQELQEIIKVCEEDARIAKESGGNPFLRMLREPAVRKAVLIGCTLQLFQQLSGINTGKTKWLFLLK